MEESDQIYLNGWDKAYTMPMGLLKWIAKAYEQPTQEELLRRQQHLEQLAIKTVNDTTLPMETRTHALSHTPDKFIRHTVLYATEPELRAAGTAYLRSSVENLTCLRGVVEDVYEGKVVRAAAAHRSKQMARILGLDEPFRIQRK